MLALVLLIMFGDELQHLLEMDEQFITLVADVVLITFEDVDLQIGVLVLIMFVTVVFFQMVACTQKIVNNVFIDQILLPAGFEPAIFGMRIQYPRPARRREHIAYVEIFSIQIIVFSIALAWTRTMNLQLRRLLLYPLSY